jgi:tRNA threonylcarbamoyladenosine biosynthesis protein TsaB
MNPLILSIETATLGGGVCLSEGDKVLAATWGDPKLSHSNTLLSDIERCLRAANAKVQDVQLFAAASGPGSFTGLRIGLATIKGLAATLDRPCVGIPTLQAVAHSAGVSNATVTLLPAGRGEVFIQLLSVDGDVAELDDARHLPPANAIKRYLERQSLKWAGPGALTHRALIESTANDLRISCQVVSNGDTPVDQGWQIVQQSELGLVKHVGAIAWRRFQRNELERPETLSAIYVRPSDAELKCNPA